MSKLRFLAAASFFVALTAACSDDDTGSQEAPAVDAGTDAAPDPGRSDADPPEIDAGREGGQEQTCTAAAEQLLQPIDSVSTGEVTELGTDGDITTVFVDASAGGTAGASSNPRLYVSLASRSRVDVTDKTAGTSAAWDLALKRAVLFTNGGHGGSGQGEAAFLPGKEIAEVTAADATSATFRQEVFFDAECNPQTDEAGAVRTSFDGWYDYELATHAVTPKLGTWLVKGATGQLFKVQIMTYTGLPDGGIGMSGGRYVLKVGAL